MTQALRRTTMAMIKHAFATEEGMNILLDKMMLLVEQNEILQERNDRQAKTIDELNNMVHTLEESKKHAEEMLLNVHKFAKPETGSQPLDR